MSRVQGRSEPVTRAPACGTIDLEPGVIVIAMPGVDTAKAVYAGLDRRRDVEELPS